MAWYIKGVNADDSNSTTYYVDDSSTCGLWSSDIADKKEYSSQSDANTKKDDLNTCLADRVVNKLSLSVVET